MNKAEDKIRVHLAAEWIVLDEIIPREKLFASGYLREGKDITVKALKANLINEEGHRIPLLVGYETINNSGVHTYANRINIEDEPSNSFSAFFSKRFKCLVGYPNHTTPQEQRKKCMI